MPRKTFPGAQAVDMHRARPSRLRIAGIDTPDDPRDPLWVPKERLATLRDDSMVLSIAKDNLLEPVVVEMRGDEFFVVLGRRRTFNAQTVEANASKGAPPFTIPILIRRPSPADAVRWIAAENSQREDDTPIARARAAHRMASMFDVDIKDVAVAFRVTPAAVRNWFKTLDTTPAVQKAVEAGRLPAAAAAKLAALPGADQETELAKLLDGSAKPTTTRAAAAAKTARARAVDPAATETRATPGKRLLAKMIHHHDPHPSPLKPAHLEMLRWMVGEIPDSKIRGMAALRRAVEKGGAE